MPKHVSYTVTLSSVDEARLLFGEADQWLKAIEEVVPVQVVGRGASVKVKGTKEDVEKAKRLIGRLRRLIAEGTALDRMAIHTAGKTGGDRRQSDAPSEGSDSIPVPSKRKFVQPKTGGQTRYVDAIRTHDIVFAVGPAGTGKSYLAVAMAVNALRSGEVSRIVLVRPAVEAGERLGYLPGTYQEKVDPYLRPLYDALYDTLEADKFKELLERGVIEVAPLAFMRGRTLNDSFIILDEAQNTTVEQMKMFLTRLGFDSRAVVTGDITQTDLPEHKMSGLLHVMDILKDVPGIGFVMFDERDVVRHELVQRIIRAYAHDEKKPHK